MTAKLVLRQPANCMQKDEWHVASDDGRLLQQVLLGSGQRIDTRSEHRLHRARDLDARERPRKAVVATPAFEHASIDQRSHDLFHKEWISAGALHQEALQAGKLGSEPNKA